VYLPGTSGGVHARLYRPFESLTASPRWTVLPLGSMESIDTGTPVTFVGFT